MQTWQHALQSACKLVGLWRHAHANSRGLVATRMQTRSPAHCNQPTHCAIRSQTAGFGMQTRRPLAILCIDLTLLHLDLAYQPAGFATSLHTRALASRLACDGGLWLCTQPASAAPHLQTVARTSCKLSSAQQHFAYGLHKFALRLQQSIRGLQPACIRLCVRATILPMAAFGFASSLRTRRLAALRMQAACKPRGFAVCCRLARSASGMQTVARAMQRACKLRALGCKRHASPQAACASGMQTAGYAVRMRPAFAELCAGLASLQLIDALTRINFAYVMESQAHLLDCANSQARHKVSHCYAG